MRIKRTSGALITSMVLHLVVAFVTGIYLLTQTPRFQEFIRADVIQLKAPPGPQVRKPVVKSVMKPTLPERNTFTEQIQLQPRVTAVFLDRLVFQPRRVFAISEQTIKVNPPVDPNVPRVTTPGEPVPTATTPAGLTVSDAPDALAFSSPVASAPSVRLANTYRGVAGTAVQVKVAFERPAWTDNGRKRRCRT